MSKPVLLDTNVLILGLAGQEPAATLLKEVIIEHRLVLSVVSVAEFLVKASSKEEELLNKLVGEFPVLSVDLEVAKLAATLRKDHLKKKQKLHLPDCLIAAQAIINKTQFATFNTGDFPKDKVDLYSWPKK